MKQNIDRFSVTFDNKNYNLRDRSHRIEYGIKKWEKLIKGLANKFKNSVSGYDDFIQEASLIIVKVVDSWDPERGNFDTFLYECIKNGIIDASSRTRHAVSIPSGSYRLAEDIKTTRFIYDVPEEGDKFEHIDICDTIEKFDTNDIGKMYFVEKYTMREIEEKTGINICKVHRIIKDMRSLIKKRLQKC